MDPSLSDSLRRVDALIVGQGGEATERRSMASVPVEALRRTLADRSLPSAERRAAFSVLSERLHGENSLSEMVLSLLDEADPEPDVDLARDAIAAAPPFDGRVIERLRRLIHDSRPEIWTAAAAALSRKKDHASLPRMLDWARRGDQDHRRAGLAAVAFLLIPEEHLAVVESICEDGPRDDEDESLLVDALRVAEARVAFWRKALGEEEP